MFQLKSRGSRTRRFDVKAKQSPSFLSSSSSSSPSSSRSRLFPQRFIKRRSKAMISMKTVGVESFQTGNLEREIYDDYPFERFSSRRVYYAFDFLPGSSDILYSANTSGQFNLWRQSPPPPPPGEVQKNSSLEQRSNSQGSMSGVYDSFNLSRMENRLFSSPTGMAMKIIRYSLRTTKWAGKDRL